MTHEKPNHDIIVALFGLYLNHPLISLQYSQRRQRALELIDDGDKILGDMARKC